MKLFVDTPENIARAAAKKYITLLREKPDAVLGFATGSTPLTLYNELARLYKTGEISFKQAKTFNLDEYAGMKGIEEQSYRRFMDENLFSKIDIARSNTHVPSGMDIDAAPLYDEAIEAAGGIDLQLLGIGNDGHIGFNEPGTPFGSKTHHVKLTEMTREANKRFFSSVDEVPTHAITMGIKTVMNAKKIIFIALGEDKADIVKQAFLGEVTPEVPASVLQLHPFVEVYLDKSAAKKL
ncbi:MAG TPA: glucosamine-6-phosphate deaminase [Oscillospiraceae bacterium]|nr:glucosamine-6-phosphate deaminase [Oscillospiraceae bacterium]HPF54972.1 glucosamine-6-phosphate deaminase [Clostridiales bacterium]HPK34385.1 glucosamine-6-phosphate deaminase [Oscillospiraceae bacterium]HPR75831.1 glucosamine-6-phosphate deaminase [Oscillospiraceae bacterium]